MQRWIFIKIWKAQRELQSKDCHKAYEGTMETSSRAGSQRLWLCSDSWGCWNSIFFHCSFHFSPNALMSGIMYLAAREEEPSSRLYTLTVLFSHLMIPEVEQFRVVILWLRDILKDPGGFDLSSLQPSGCQFCLDWLPCGHNMAAGVLAVRCICNGI